MRNIDNRPDPTNRVALEWLVDSFIHQELPSSEAASIAYAAREFERRADALPVSQQQLVRRFAAALHERVARLRGRGGSADGLTYPYV
jgi:hypothetical protein